MQSEKGKNIVVIGSINMDLVVNTARHPELGETILGLDFHTFPGGKGANQSVAAARLGANVKMVGRLGSDPFGDQLLENIRANGVDASYILRDPQSPTGVALITVNEEGDNTIVVVPGANWRVSAEDVQAAEPAFENASVVIMQHELPAPVVEEAVRLGRAHGLKVVLNPAPARELGEDLLCNVDYLIPNQSELALLTGVESTEAAINMLQGLGVKNLIVTLGEDGVLIATGNRQTRILAYQVAAVDTTAAGDAFIGAFAVALTEGLDLYQAAAWGNAAGALAATKPGAQPSLPTRKELEGFLHLHPDDL